jgi:hypothetical protein
MLNQYAVIGELGLMEMKTLKVRSSTYVEMECSRRIHDFGGQQTGTRYTLISAF